MNNQNQGQQRPENTKPKISTTPTELLADPVNETATGKEYTVSGTKLVNFIYQYLQKNGLQVGKDFEGVLMQGIYDGATRPDGTPVTTVNFGISFIPTSQFVTGGENHKGINPALINYLPEKMRRLRISDKLRSILAPLTGNNIRFANEVKDPKNNPKQLFTIYVYLPSLMKLYLNSVDGLTELELSQGINIIGNPAHPEEVIMRVIKRISLSGGKTREEASFRQYAEKVALN